MIRYFILILGAALLVAACRDRKDTTTPNSTDAKGVISSFSDTVGPAAAIHHRLEGTWRLLTGTTITKGISAVTDYTKDQSMIKIINGSHFAFLRHRIGEPKDSSNQFDAGGGSYSLHGDQYTEHLDYYSDKNWEGKTFDFTISFDQDTLIQRGREKLEKEGIDREIVEKYLRVK